MFYRVVPLIPLPIVCVPSFPTPVPLRFFRSKDSSEVIVSGSKTEGALLSMLESSFGVDYQPIRAASFDARRGDRLFTFSSARKKMSVLMVNGSKRHSGVSFTKGAAEVIIGCCTR